MIGAGTVINPIIKIVTTVAILAATYVFIRKPVLETTEKAVEGAGRQIEAQQRASPGEPGRRPAVRDEPRRVLRRRLQSSLAGGGTRGQSVHQARRQRRARDGSLRRARPGLAHTVQSDRSFALSADSLAARRQRLRGRAGRGLRQARGLPARRDAALPKPGRRPAVRLPACRRSPLGEMLGAGTVINPIIKIVTVVAILAATYFLHRQAGARHDREHFDAASTPLAGFGDLPARSRRTSTRHSRRRIAPAPCRTASIERSPAPRQTRSASTAASSASRPRGPRRSGQPRESIRGRTPPALALGQLALDPVEAAQLPAEVVHRVHERRLPVAGTTGEPFS